MLKIKECPKCHSKEGYYQKMSYRGSGIYRYGFINDDGKPEEIENGDMYDCLITESSKYYYCLNCKKRIGLADESN